MGKKKDETDIEEFGSEVDISAEDNASISMDLSEKEKLQLEKEARSEVAKAIKAAKMKDFKAAAKKRIQAEAMFSSGKDDNGEDLVEVDLQLASYPKYIMLDGQVYHSGRKYKKRRAVAAVLLDQMDRGWRQEAARLGERTEWAAEKKKILSRNGLQIH